MLAMLRHQWMGWISQSSLRFTCATADDEAAVVVASAAVGTAGGEDRDDKGFNDHLLRF